MNYKRQCQLSHKKKLREIAKKNRVVNGKKIIQRKRWHIPKLAHLYE